MIEIDKSRLGFKLREVWFAPEPFDVPDVDRVIFMDCKGDVDRDDFKKTVFPTMVVDLDVPLDEVRSRMGKTVRQELNRAARDGLQIKEDEEYEAFRALDADFRRVRGLPGEAPSTDFMEEHGLLLTAWLEGELLSGILLLSSDRDLRYFIGVSRPVDGDKTRRALVGRANKHLIWLALERAAALGLPYFDLGGIATGPDISKAEAGINEFKARFGGRRVDHFIYEKSYSRLYEALGRVRGIIGGLHG